MGTFTFGAAAPGLNRHRLKVLVVELSRIGLPILCAIDTSVTVPLAVSTLRTATPLPVT
jgi:hypothetical protein